MHKPTREEFQQLIDQIPNWKEVLNNNDTVTMIQYWLSGESYRQIAPKFNLSINQIYNRIVGNNKTCKGSAYLKLLSNRPEIINRRIEKKEQKQRQALQNIVRILENIKDNASYTKTGKIRKKRRIEIKPRKPYKQYSKIKIKISSEIKEGMICPDCKIGIIGVMAMNDSNKKLLICNNCKQFWII